MALGAEQGGVGHHEFHPDRDRTGGGLAGDPLDQGVGHDLAATSLVTRARRESASWRSAAQQATAWATGRKPLR
jgi:hypothetical protein